MMFVFCGASIGGLSDYFSKKFNEVPPVTTTGSSAKRTEGPAVLGERGNVVSNKLVGQKKLPSPQLEAITTY